MKPDESRTRVRRQADRRHARALGRPRARDRRASRARLRSPPSTASGSSGSSGSCASPARRELVELPAGTARGGRGAARAPRQRELREECGLTGGDVAPTSRAFWTTPGFCREHMIVFLAEDVEPGETGAGRRRGGRGRATAARRARRARRRARGREDARRAPPLPAAPSRQLESRLVRIGVAKEIKTDEYRVALTPAGARELVQRGPRRARRDGRRRRQRVPGLRLRACRRAHRLASTTSGREAELLLKVKEPIARRVPAPARRARALHVPPHRGRRAAHARARRQRHRRGRLRDGRDRRRRAAAARADERDRRPARVAGRRVLPREAARRPRPAARRRSRRRAGPRRRSSAAASSATTPRSSRSGSARR